MKAITKKKETFCGNCGRKGHIYKKCHYPVTSLGIICIKFDKINLNYLLSKTKKLLDRTLSSTEIANMIKTLSDIDEDYIANNMKFLLIRRRNSLSIVEFLRGKYKLDDIDYLYNTFNLMTINERKEIMTVDFDTLWSNLWNKDRSSKNHINEFENSKHKYNLLKEGIELEIGNLPVSISLNTILENINTTWEEPEWGFPKGRRNIREKDINCAIREFSEETNYSLLDYQLLNLEKIVESYLGTNNIRYKHTYYIGQITSAEEPMINKNNINQITEIGDIGWYSFNDGMNLIRAYNLEKKNVLRNLNNILKIILLNSKELFLKSEETNSNEQAYEN